MFGLEISRNLMKFQMTKKFKKLQRDRKNWIVRLPRTWEANFNTLAAIYWEVFTQFFKMAAILKMAEKRFSDHNSVSFEHFCILFLNLSLYFNRTYFLEEKFLIKFKMASDVQDGGRNSKEHDIKISNDFAFLAILDHESRPYFVKLIKNDGSIQNGG
jgi:hypothetical protein